MVQCVSTPAGMRLILLLCIMGFGFGVLITVGMDPSVVPMMHLVAEAQVSVVSLVLCGLLPLLIAAYAVKIHSFPLLLLVLFLRCFCNGCFCWLVAKSFCSAAWLLSALLGFSGNMHLLLLLLFGCLSIGREWNGRIFRVFIFLTIVVALIDYFAVSPFLRAVLLT